ncbi:MAG: hypothetical protein ACR5K2_05335 [Wolbachia sp.]
MGNKDDKGEQYPPARKGGDTNPEEVIQNWDNDSRKRYLISKKIVNNKYF